VPAGQDAAAQAVEYKHMYYYKTLKGIGFLTVCWHASIIWTIRLQNTLAGCNAEIVLELFRFEFYFKKN
jgi:hypothetical protein